MMDFIRHYGSKNRHIHNINQLQYLKTDIIRVKVNKVNMCLVSTELLYFFLL